MIISRRREEVIAETGKILGRIRDDEGRVVRIRLIPKMTALNDVSRRSPAPIAAAVRHEYLSALVIIEAPLVAAAVGEYLEMAAHRVITPHARAEFDALRVGRARFSDAGVVEHSLVAIEPTVRPPHETVQTLVRVLVSEAVQQYLRRPVRHIVVVAIGNEQQFRSE